MREPWKRIAAALAGAALVLLVALPVDARAERFSAETAEAIDPLDAVATLSGFSSHSCDTGAYRVTGVRLRFECGATSEDLLYRNIPLIIVEGAWFRLRRADGQRPSGTTGFDTSSASVEQRAQWARAWVSLARPRTPAEPQSDAPFLASIAAAPTSDAEALRRVQVQVEAALRANRNIDAARLYRDALRTSPSWADGHYNYGLLLGDLELYPEAITAMRRYLHLKPNAEDARAVQDKIYEWEAAMQARP